MHVWQLNSLSLFWIIKLKTKFAKNYIRNFVFSAVIDGFLIVNQMGNCCIYVVFVAENFKMAIDLCMKYPVSIEFYILTVCLVPCALMLSVRNLKWLAPFSLGATIMSFITIGVVIYYVSDLPTIEDRSLFGTATGYPLFFGTVLFAVSSIGVVSGNSQFSKNIFQN